MDRDRLEIITINSRTILINWPQKVDEQILEDVIRYSAILRAHFGSQLENYTPAYASLMLTFVDEVDLVNIEPILLKLYNQEGSVIITPRYWEIPVCYHSDFGIDHTVFFEKGFTSESLIEAHTSPQYRVYMIGFLPGFLYLGGLPKTLHTPRKKNPTLRTPAGAVAIGGEQTGIYPMKSPGGWQIIGKTPLKLFDINKDIPTPIKQGDYVKFYAIDREVFHVLQSEE